MKTFGKIITFTLILGFFAVVIATAEEPEAEVYVVKKDESLYEIAKEKLGDANLWPQLATYNQIDNPDFIRAGQKIVIPPESELLVRVKEMKRLETEIEKLEKRVAALEKRLAEMEPVYVLALTGNESRTEFSVLEKFDRVNRQNIRYIQTKNKRLPRLSEVDMLWIGQGEIAEDKQLLDKDTEENIKDFVKKGGVVIVVGQDSDPDRPCETGWITGRIVGVERSLRSDFQPTQKAKSLFRIPNKVKSGQLHINDTWTNWDEKFDILATTNSGKDIVVATLKEGSGLYIVTGIQNETKDDLKANAPLMENLIYFAVNWLRKNFK